MANRLFDNVIVIDSAMGNLNAVGGTSSNITNYHIIGFAFLGTTTASTCTLSGASTTDHVFRATYVSNAGSAGTAATLAVLGLQSLTFSSPLRLSALKVPLLTTGTAWVYLA